MPRALWNLIRMRWRAQLRRAARRARTPRGALATLFMMCVMLWLVGSSLFGYLFGSAAATGTAGVARDFFPIALFGLWLLSALSAAGDRAVSFSPAEVDLLFSAPFSRRQLLAYKLVNAAPALLIMPLFLLPAAAPHVRYLPAAIIAMWLLLTFMQLSAMALAFLRHSVAELAYSRRRRIALIAVTIVVTLGVMEALAEVDLADWRILCQRFHHSWAGACLLAPFDVFCRAALAESPLEATGWLAGSLAIDAVMLAVVFRLDAAFLEIAADVSRKQYELRARFRRGGGIAKVNASVGRRLPRFPFWAGAGPVAWRQTLHLLRTLKNIAWSLLTMSVVLVIGLRYTGRNDSAVVAGTVLTVIGYVSFVLTMSLPMGLRLDVDRLDVLKSLPLAPAAVVWGELLPACALLAAIQIVPMLALLAIAPRDWPLGAAAAAFTPLLNLMMVGCDNLLFLLYPYRTAEEVAGDFQAMSRQMFLMFLRIPLLAASFGVAAAAGGVTAFLLPGRWLPPLAIGWLVLFVESLLLVWCTIWAFRRFDVSTETPA